MSNFEKWYYTGLVLEPHCLLCFSRQGLTVTQFDILWFLVGLWTSLCRNNRPPSCHRLCEIYPVRDMTNICPFQPFVDIEKQHCG